ncbi:uncharacterized protein TNIN_200731 [Trichonephila inaurata madagascariensis]|nr:uncharacterized protein TNIN_200731 [Trichonephila inaurata madagascariensis]
MYLRNLTFRTGLKWEVFSSLHGLGILEVKNSAIPEIDQTFERYFPQRVTWLFLNSTNTKQLSDDSFSKLTELSRLHVQNSEIKELKRSMFPPRSKLIDLNFSDSPISTLPYDIFSNMPNLQGVFLSHTNIVTIEETVFGQIFSQLYFFYMEGNEIDCNCQMKWLTKQDEFPTNLKVTCTKPKSVEGLSISELRPSHFAHCE